MTEKHGASRVFIAGATGAMGMPLVRRLLGQGYTVVGLTRTEAGARKLEALGAEAAVGDALDRSHLRAIVAAARPNYVVHLLTALPKQGAARARDLAATNELRISGTANLLHAAEAAGARRLVAESFPMVYGLADRGSGPLPESAPLNASHRNQEVQAIVDALRSLEQQVLTASAEGRIEGIVLRYGYVYGEGVPSTEAMFDQLLRRKLPVVRGAPGIGSFIHVEDAAAATAAALERGAKGGIYNIADDTPLGLMEFIREAASSIGAPPPWSVPKWIAGLAAPLGVELAWARLPLSNALAKRELKWQPSFSSVTDGLRAAAMARLVDRVA